jgi:hypothetical protein
MKLKWYEVFRSNEEGTQTVTNCSTIISARKYRKQYNRYKLPNEEFFIDKWENSYNPRIINMNVV